MSNLSPPISSQPPQRQQPLFYISLNKETWGPYTEGQLDQHLRDKAFIPSNLANIAGTSDWHPISHYFPHLSPPSIQKKEPKPKPKQYSLFALVCCIGVAVLTYIAVSSFKSDGSQYESDDHNTTPRLAYRYATEIIKGKMKAPSQTTFSNAISDSSAHYDQRSDGLYDVGGWVESPNSFGVMLRKDWRMVLDYRNSAYHLIWLKLGDETTGNLPPDEVSPPL
jgi:hypothetical protein